MKRKQRVPGSTPALTFHVLHARRERRNRRQQARLGRINRFPRRVGRRKREHSIPGNRRRQA